MDLRTRLGKKDFGFPQDKSLFEMNMVAFVQLALQIGSLHENGAGLALLGNEFAPHTQAHTSDISPPN